MHATKKKFLGTMILAATVLIGTSSFAAPTAPAVKALNIERQSNFFHKDYKHEAETSAAAQSLLQASFNLPTSGPGSLKFISSGTLPSDGTFTVPAAFSYLAIGFENKGTVSESLFHFTPALAANTLFVENATNREDYYAFTTVSAVPEPATYVLLMAGLAATAFVIKRRKNI